MILLIDIGNTRLKWGLLSAGKLGQQRAVVYQQDLLSSQLEQEWSTLASPLEIYLVSVARKEITQAVIEWAANRWDCPVEALQSGKQEAGVVNGYLHPERLGVDRWMAMIGAYHLAGSAVCVFDCGTALTCDAIDSHGQHLGGIIAPGQEMMRRSLLQSTAGIQLAETSPPLSGWGTDTTSCVLAGGVQASVGLIERLSRQLQAQLDAPVSLVLTGGDAENLLSWLSLPYRYEVDLVLQGLARVVMERRG